MRRYYTMQYAKHPDYKEVKVDCSCGNSFITHSTLGKNELHLEICSACHPFYTGKQKMIDTGGRVQRFKDRYNKKSASKAAENTEK